MNVTYRALAATRASAALAAFPWRSAVPGVLRAGAAMSAIALLSVTAAQWLRVRHALRTARTAWSVDRPYECRPEQPFARVLVLGDSTGVGLGANLPGESIPGILSAEHPQVEITNLAVSGARLEDVRKQVAALAPGGAASAYDLILLMVGGNDVLRLTPLGRLAQDADVLLPELARLGRKVLWLCSANIGLAPMFVPPLSWWASFRTYRVCMLFERMATRHGVRFISVFRQRGEEPFSSEPSIYFSLDGVHPSSAAYRVCYEHLREAACLNELITEAKRRHAARVARAHAAPARVARDVVRP
jgi:lysophospholipase L1-like esterase